MQLVDVAGHALSSPIDPPQQRAFAGGVRRLNKRDVVLVVVETTDGERGVAPAGASSSEMREYFDDASHDTFADVVDTTIADRLNGESIEHAGQASELLADAPLPSRLYHQAVSAIDIALHDLEGRIVGTPIYDLLSDRAGTTPATELPMYASAGMYMAPAGYARQASILEDAGFFGYKYRPGIGPAGDRRIVERLDESVGLEIMIDAHTWWKVRDGAYDRDTVTSLVEHASAHDAYWVEEPVRPDDYAGYRALADCDVALAGGESESSPDGLRALADTGAVSFLQGDVRHHHGFTGCWEIAAYCAGADVEFVPHNFGTWLGLVANAHLVAAAPAARLLEYPIFEDDPTLECADDPGMYPFPLDFDILADTLAISDGVLSVPDGPGLGVDVDISVIERYPHIEGPWTEFAYHS